MRKQYIGVISFVLFFSLMACAKEKRKNSNEPDKPRSELKKETFKSFRLKGFTQPCCTSIVQYSLEELDGYVRSKPIISKQELQVWYDSTRCTEKQVIEAIDRTGYTVMD